MKLIFNLFLFIFLSSPSFSQNLLSQYLIKTKGITVGDMLWELNLQNGAYETKIEVKNRGFLSGLYSFSGSYVAYGKIVNKILIPTKYTQRWQTKKKSRNIEILFKQNTIDYLEITPTEIEKPRIAYIGLVGYKDPLSSFINIILYGGLSYTVDGRRMYVLFPKTNNDHTIISIKYYKNIWTDHKRNDLEYIRFYGDKENILPKKIDIKFKGSVFSLIKN